MSDQKPKVRPRVRVKLNDSIIEVKQETQYTTAPDSFTPDYLNFKLTEDNDHNAIVGKNGRVTIVLNNASYKQNRSLGKIVHLDGVVTWVKQEKEKDKFRKTNSWSLPYALVNFLPENANILFESETHNYKISRKKIFEFLSKVNSYLWFKGRGMERKVYIPISEWTID